jgi:hypothetical protein
MKSKPLIRLVFQNRAHSIRSNCIPWLLPLLLVVLFARIATGTEPQDTASNSVGPTSQYTVADFDGDFRPDLVGVQTGRSGFSGTQYWIELELSSEGRQSIPVFATPGGIQIAARDVNGDRSLDLVLTTTGRGQPVAILLNDGHGGFTRVDPAAYPNAFRDTSTLGSHSREGHDCPGIPPSSTTGAVVAESRIPVTGSYGVSQTCPSLRLSRFLSSQLGRAPPFQSAYL